MVQRRNHNKLENTLSWTTTTKNTKYQNLIDTPKSVLRKNYNYKYQIKKKKISDWYLFFHLRKLAKGELILKQAEVEIDKY